MSIVRSKDWNDLVRMDYIDKEDIILELLKQKELKRKYGNTRFRLG